MGCAENKSQLLHYTTWPCSQATECKSQKHRWHYWSEAPKALKKWINSAPEKARVLTEFENIFKYDIDPKLHYQYHDEINAERLLKRNFKSHRKNTWIRKYFLWNSRRTYHVKFTYFCCTICQFQERCFSKWQGYSKSYKTK